jgi:hypothetical protein
MNWYYRLHDKENGPLSEETIREIHRCGVLNDGSIVRAEDSERWLPYSEALGHSASVQTEEETSAEIKFSCPHCQQHISTESSSAGLTGSCPSCGGDIVIPSARTNMPEPACPLAPEGLESGYVEPGNGSADEPVYAPDIAAAGPSAADRIKSGAKAGWAGVKRNSKIAALHAQIEKLRNVDLRKAYHTLGKRCYEVGLLEDLLATPFEAIREIEARIAADRKTEQAPEDEKKTDALKRMTRQAANATHAQALNIKLQHHLTELGRLAYPHNEQGSLPGLEAEVEAIGVVETLIRQKENEIEALGTRQTGRTKSRSLITVSVVAAVLLLSVVILKSMLAHEPTKFWHFELGCSKKECVDIMKRLKDNGTFKELESTTVLAGWLSGSKCITGYTFGSSPTSLDGILSIPTKSISLYFFSDELAAIEVSYSFRENYPSNLASTLAGDMETCFGRTFHLEKIEDSVGNKATRRVMVLSGATVTIKDDPNSEFAPDIRILEKSLSKEKRSLSPLISESNKRDSQPVIASDSRKHNDKDNTFNYTPEARTSSPNISSGERKISSNIPEIDEAIAIIADIYPELTRSQHITMLEDISGLKMTSSANARRAIQMVENLKSAARIGGQSEREFFDVSERQRRGLEEEVRGVMSR